MPSFETVGRQAGQLVKAVLDGGPPASLHLPALTPNTLTIDWRQAQRFAEAGEPQLEILRLRS